MNATGHLWCKTSIGSGRHQAITWTNFEPNHIYRDLAWLCHIELNGTALKQWDFISGAGHYNASDKFATGLNPEVLLPWLHILTPVACHVCVNKEVTGVTNGLLSGMCKTENNKWMNEPFKITVYPSFQGMTPVIPKQTTLCYRAVATRQRKSTSTSTNITSTPCR